MRIILCALIVLFVVVRLSAAPSEPPAEAVAKMLPAEPAGPGRPISDRAAWRKLGKTSSYNSAVRRAEGLLKQPIADSPDELYLDFSKTGNRTRWQRVAGRRRGRIGYLTLAECVENKGRFVAAFEKAAEAVCAERTWVMPAHDRSLTNFKGTSIDIDLGAAHLAWNLATARWLLGEKLPPRTRELIRSNLRRRIFDPYLAMVDGKREPNWWTKTTNNWNAVCLAGVTGAALATIESPAERARFVVAAREYSRSFLRGFTADGYCSEGLGYWGYGFGYYIRLSETIHQATGGKIDLLARPAARAPATFPARIEIIGEVYPAFADCGVTTKPSWMLTHFLNRRLGLGADPADDPKMVNASSSLATAMIFSMPNSATNAPAGKKKPAGPGPRSWFKDAGVLICRPGEAKACRLGAALKGGHNAEHHNHNDVGSYVVVVGRRPVLLDPGSEVYTARTFSSKRYVSKVLNSFGHPVPVVAGKGQRTGGRARGKVVKTDFTDAADTFALDFRSAYDVAELKTLRRTFVYSREGDGSLTVTDEVAFSSPKTFETALITLGKWKRTGPRTLRVSDADEAVTVEIDCGESAFEVVEEVIREDVRTKSLPTRLRIRLKAPVASATVRLKIAPSAGPAGAGGKQALLRNGGFELGNWCWRIPTGGMGSVTAEQAAEGAASLKIVEAGK